MQHLSAALTLSSGWGRGEGDPTAGPPTGQISQGGTRLLDQGWQSLSVNGQTVNIFGFVGHSLSQLLISALVV